MPTSLVVGASRGFGKALACALASGSIPGLKAAHNVYGTVRTKPKDDAKAVQFIEGVDLTHEQAATAIVDGLKGAKVDFVWLVAGLLVPESFDSLKWDGQIDMYKICAIAPIFIIQALIKAEALTSSSKVVYFTSEGGSIALRTLEEGGGMYGHHGSKAASNMSGKLLSLDLHPRGIPVLILHPSFMRTDMTEKAFGKETWEKGGAVPPEEAIPKIWQFVEESGMERSGQFWAPNGPADIGQAENVLGKNLPTPLQIPW